MRKRVGLLIVAAFAALGLPSQAAAVSPLPVAQLRPSPSPTKPNVQTVGLAGIVASSLAQTVAVAPARQAQQLASVLGVDPTALAVSPAISTAPIALAHFDAVGLSWERANAPASVAAWVRVREAGTWSSWTLMAPLDIGPDASTGEGHPDRVATEPLITKGADALQVRVDASGTPRDVRASLVEAGRSTADGLVSPATVTPHADTAVPVGAPPKPYVISRAQWGADESLRTHPPEYTGAVKVGIVHHTVTPNDYSPADSYATVRSIYAYHTLVLGWNDIAYNALVDKYGQIFEGRAGGLENNVLSAATAPFNTDTFAVSALGDYSQAPATGQMLESIARLLAWKLSINYVDPNGHTALMSRGFEGSPYPAGTFVTFPNIIGHRDAYPTACPGQFLYDDLDWIRARVTQLTPAGLVQPRATTTYRTPGNNGAVRVTSRLLWGGQWAVVVQRPDGTRVASWYGSGTAIDVTWPMTDGALPAPEGRYTITVLSNQNGVSALDYVTSTFTSSVIGNFESTVARPSGTEVNGWTLVSNGETATVAVVVDGNVVARGTADRFRPDVASVFPAYGPQHGFVIPVSMAPGPHSVCVYGEQTAKQSQLLGCQVYRELGHDPIGHVDAVDPLYGGVRLRGWTLDRDTTGPINALRAVDGGTLVSSVASDARSDIGTAYPGYGPAHGFDISMPITPGTHTLCAAGQNVGPGSDGFLGCLPVSAISGMPVGHLDAVTSANGVRTVDGWTFDPDTTQPITIHLYVDWRPVVAVVADRARPDVGAAFPFMGANHGFRFSLPLGAGQHSVCVFAINVGPGAGNPLIGCATA